MWGSRTSRNGCGADARACEHSTCGAAAGRGRATVDKSPNPHGFPAGSPLFYSPSCGSDRGLLEAAVVLEGPGCRGFGDGARKPAGGTAVTDTTKPTSERPFLDRYFCLT